MQPPSPHAEERFRELLALVARLRSPGGCPWDQSRRPEDISRYLLEESYEVVEAIEGKSPPALMEELGDLLFQILFLARMADEKEEFNIADVMKAVAEKMIRRHPHVFGNARVKNVAEVRDNWERIKKEVEHKGAGDPRLFDDVPRSLPILVRTQQITARASTVGFDWHSTAEVLKKVEEELGEFRAALGKGDQAAVHEEAGDLLFTMVNLCRFVHVDAETALRSSLKKFTRRFAYIEQHLARQGKTRRILPSLKWDRRRHGRGLWRVSETALSHPLPSGRTGGQDSGSRHPGVRLRASLPVQEKDGGKKGRTNGRAPTIRISRKCWKKSRKRDINALHKTMAIGLAIRSPNLLTD